MQNETQFGRLAMIINVDRFTKSCIKKKQFWQTVQAALCDKRKEKKGVNKMTEQNKFMKINRKKLKLKLC